MRNLSKVFAMSALLVLFATACSAEANFTVGGISVEDSGKNLIEGELASLLSIELEAVCPALEDPEVGSTFECTGTTPDGRIAKFEGVVDSDDSINVVSTNVIQAELVPNVEDAAVNALEPQTGPVEVNCGTETLILDSEESVTCAISDGAETRDVLLTFSSLDPIQFNASIQ